MKTKIILSLLLSCLIPNFVFAASVNIKGTYSGYVYYISGTPVGTGTCYSQSEFPYGSFTLVKVKQDGTTVTGRYWNGSSYVKTTGKRTKSGFTLALNYKLSGYTYAYTIKATSVTASTAYINLSGKTNWTSTYGCKYVFAGTVTHS